MSSVPSYETASFGRYRLLEQLGSGGMAVVHRAIAEDPGGVSRSLVVKRIRPELAKSAEFVEALIVEARISALLHHPAIVQMYEFGQVGDEYFIAMEYVDGVSLGALMRRSYERKLLPPIAAICYAVSEVAAGLAYAHALTDQQGRALQIVHRDVSPTNIMVTRAGAVKLLDFGIAKAAQHVRETAETRTGDLKGKLGYLSPEQAEGLPMDRRADVFALGVVMHEALVLKRLFKGSHDFETLRLVREAKVRAPSSLRPEIDFELDAIVLKMLARDPAERFQSCDEVVAALRPLLHRRHVDAEATRAFVAGLGPFAELEQVAPTPERPRHATGSTMSGSAGELRAADEALDAGTATSRRSRVIGAVVIAGMATAAVIAGMGLSPAPKPPPASALRMQADPSRPPAPAPAIAPSAPSVAPTAAPEVHLKVAGPRGAEVLVDGVRMGTAPLDVTLPRVAGASRMLLVRGPHGAESVQLISSSEDFELAAPHHSSRHHSGKSAAPGDDPPSAELAASPGEPGESP
jgi:serine/threonine-protein kinase